MTSTKNDFHLKKLYADKILDLTNIGVGATLFSQFVADKAFSWLTTIVGFFILLVGYLISYWAYPKK